MSEQEELVLDMSHVASLAMAIWIYLIAQNEEAREIIGNLADKLKSEMDGSSGEEERVSQNNGNVEDGQG